MVSAKQPQMPRKIDVSLYLVTSSDSLPEDLTLEASVRLAISGGVRVVQLREKSLATDAFLQRALELRKICQPPVRLIINDRVDIALASGADGVHLGQEDMPIKVARKLLGDAAIIGSSVTTITEAVQAAEQGADYLGVGTCWATSTKAIPSHKIIGPRGVKAIRDAILDLGYLIPLVAIGGINETNILRTLYGCVPNLPEFSQDPCEAPIGIAVVSNIMSSPNPYLAAVTLNNMITNFRESVPSNLSGVVPVGEGVANALDRFCKCKSPRLIHHITNTVVQNDCANLTLALGCSPLMSSNLAEMADLVCSQRGSLVFNLGTLDENQVKAMKTAGQLANLWGKPVVFDPVGIGASRHRAVVAEDLLNAVQMSIIKGNQAEIATLAQVKTNVETCGVDSTGSLTDPGKLVKDLARRERCIVVMTGAEDWISDGTKVVKLKNGIDLLSRVTGSGCMAGSAIACFAASTHWATATPKKPGVPIIVDNELFFAAILGISAINVTANRWQTDFNTHADLGPQSLRATLIDQLYHLNARDFIPGLAMKEVKI